VDPFRNVRSLEHLKAGDEMLYHYGDKYWRNHPLQKQMEIPHTDRKPNKTLQMIPLPRCPLTTDMTTTINKVQENPKNIHCFASSVWYGSERKGLADARLVEEQYAGFTLTPPYITKDDAVKIAKRRFAQLTDLNASSNPEKEKPAFLREGALDELIEFIEKQFRLHQCRSVSTLSNEMVTYVQKKYTSTEIYIKYHIDERSEELTTKPIKFLTQKTIFEVAMDLGCPAYYMYTRE
jgi:hypothetical protein